MKEALGLRLGGPFDPMNNKEKGYDPVHRLTFIAVTKLRSLP